MIQNLLDEFKKILNETDWMDDYSKKVALEKVFIGRENFYTNIIKYVLLLTFKVEMMDFKVGYSESLYNNTYLDEIYDDVYEI
jgi:hypothetical protein